MPSREAGERHRRAQPQRMHYQELPPREEYSGEYSMIGKVPGYVRVPRSPYQSHPFSGAYSPQRSMRCRDCVEIVWMINHLPYAYHFIGVNRCFGEITTVRK